MPALEWDGIVMVQSYSILRAVGMEYGYYPTDAIEMWICDSTVDACYDIFAYIAKCFFSPSEEGKEAAFKDLLENELPFFLNAMNKRLLGKVHFTGKLSIADFAFGAILSQSVYNKKSPHIDMFQKVVKNYPNVEKFWRNFEAENAKHLQSRPDSFF